MYKLVIPRENVSDNEYKIISILKKRNEFVNKNDIIGEIESSKALIELHAEEAGYFFSDRKEGEMIGVGEFFAFINPSEFDEKSNITTYAGEKKETMVSGVTITRKAEELIRTHKIQINELLDRDADKNIISERDVLKFLDIKLVEEDAEDLGERYKAFPSRNLKRIAIIGAGTSAIQIIDLILSMDEYLPACIFDDTAYKVQKKLLSVPIIGRIDFDQIGQFYKDSFFDQIIIGIPTSIPFRSHVYDELKKRKIPLANLVHKSVYIGLNVDLGEGNIILPQTHIGSCTKIGNNNYITAKCSIEHNNILGDHCTFGPGVMFSGNITVGNKVRFGTGIFIEPNVHIGDNVIVSSGSIITKDIEADTTVINSSNLKFRHGNTSR
jgi:sugar O-acyltransferase (sialic acid O-acetyltransferase NeuD family)